MLVLAISNVEVNVVDGCIMTDVPKLRGPVCPPLNGGIVLLRFAERVAPVLGKEMFPGLLTAPEGVGVREIVVERKVDADVQAVDDPGKPVPPLKVVRFVKAEVKPVPILGDEVGAVINGAEVERTGVVEFALAVGTIADTRLVAFTGVVGIPDDTPGDSGVGIRVPRREVLFALEVGKLADGVVMFEEGVNDRDGVKLAVLGNDRLEVGGTKEEIRVEFNDAVSDIDGSEATVPGREVTFELAAGLTDGLVELSEELKLTNGVEVSAGDIVRL